jgi:hypothetical protein
MPVEAEQRKIAIRVACQRNSFSAAVVIYPLTLPCGQRLIYELLQGKDLARRKKVLPVVKLFLLYE